MKSRTIWNLLSVALACCISGLYLICYMWHLFNIYDSIYVPRKPVKLVIEETPSLIVIRTFPKILAGDTYAEEDEVLIESIKENNVEDDSKSLIEIPVWDGKALTASKGVIFGPSGKETWYNLDMSRVVRSMRNRGYAEEEYPYWVRDDGCKMLGDYIIVAADLTSHAKGDIVETSLGTAIVCDTGDFARTTDVKIDIATNW